MKIMFFTDLHLRTKNPRRRLGSYEDDIMEKLTYCLVTAQKHSVDTIVCGGDLFDNPNPSFRLASKVMGLIASSQIEWLHVLGNHELVGHNLDSHDLGVLAFFKHLRNFSIMPEATNVTGTAFTMKPIHFSHGIEENKNAWKSTRFTILFAHAMITTEHVPFTHITPEEVSKFCNASIVFSGHFHDPFAFVVAHEHVSDTEKNLLAQMMKGLLRSKIESQTLIPFPLLERISIYINPGSLSRTSLLSHNLNRIPRAIILNTTPEGIELISLPMHIAKQAEEIFEIEESKAEKVWDHKVEIFLNAMENVRVGGIEASTLTINAAKSIWGVDDISDLTKEQKAVFDCALTYLGKAENGNQVIGE